MQRENVQKLVCYNMIEGAKKCQMLVTQNGGRELTTALQ